MTDADNEFEKIFRGAYLLRQQRPGGWVGICLDNFDRYWIVEGQDGSEEPCRDICHFETYAEALTVYLEWWKAGFAGTPTTTRLRLV